MIRLTSLRSSVALFLILLASCVDAPSAPRIVTLDLVTLGQDFAQIHVKVDQVVDFRMCYGVATSAETCRSWGGSSEYSVTLDGLSPATTYRYQVTVTNTHGTTTSEEKTFSTLPRDVPKSPSVIPPGSDDRTRE